MSDVIEGHMLPNYWRRASFQTFQVVTLTFGFEDWTALDSMRDDTWGPQACLAQATFHQVVIL